MYLLDFWNFFAFSDFQVFFWKWTWHRNMVSCAILVCVWVCRVFLDDLLVWSELVLMHFQFYANKHADTRSSIPLSRKKQI